MRDYRFLRFKGEDLGKWLLVALVVVVIAVPWWTGVVQIIRSCM